MSQVLLIGLGGTGSRVVNNVAKTLNKNGKQINDGNICCAILDTNTTDNNLIKKSNTGIPVIETSKSKKIREYFKSYDYLNMTQWAPDSPAFLESSMLDGASEVRVKSRIAFFDCYKSTSINVLELMINELLKNNVNQKLRVLIVSSLSGGTGSGMFIQTALWIRRALGDRDVNIRGVFLLPDIFTHTIDDIARSDRKKSRHYANAYAAMRELNALTKIRLDSNFVIDKKVVLDDLFDSEEDANSGKPVYDYVFFIDYKDKYGVFLDNIKEYEKVVAQLAYMQLFAPMSDDELHSREDNNFLVYARSHDPLYGSCGTSKAVYPVESVIDYCVCRAAASAIGTGWTSLDREIDAMIAEQISEEEEGHFSSKVIEPNVEYIKLFDEKTSVSEDEVAKDKFFLHLERDVVNEEKRRGENDRVIIKRTDKVDDFINKLVKEKIETTVGKHGDMSRFSINKDTFVEADHTENELQRRIFSDAANIDDALLSFEKNVDEYAKLIVNRTFPLSMGDARTANRGTIYGLLSKESSEKEWSFVHPVAARYLLYKLTLKLQKKIDKIKIDLRTSKEAVATGGVKKEHFDNPFTKKVTEDSPMSLLKSRRPLQSREKFLDFFEGRYAEYINSKLEECEKYEKELLQIAVFDKLLKRLKVLTEKLEDFFKLLGDVQQKLDRECRVNATATASHDGKDIYVYGSAKAKDEIYRKLNLNLKVGNSYVNKSVISSVYGSFCAQMRPDNDFNKEYKDISLSNVFIASMKEHFKQIIERDVSKREIVYLDIYTALCRECDLKIAEEKKGVNHIDDVDETESVSLAARYDAYFRSFTDTLLYAAAPFLQYEQEVTREGHGRATTEFTFWGYNPIVEKKNQNISTVLRANSDLQTSDAYPKNEFYCYRAVYGLSPLYIPKFNEVEEGAYYREYCNIIEDMLTDVEGKKGSDGYISTPHLDKRWHTILPYITNAMQEKEERKFYRGFWLAVAYGLIKKDKEGNVILKRKIKTTSGGYTRTEVPLMYNSRRVMDTHVEKILKCLKEDKTFTQRDIPMLEQRFEDDLEEISTYVGTDFYKGLVTKNKEFNPIEVVARYNDSPLSVRGVTGSLILALESFADDLARKYRQDRSEEKLRDAKYRICKKIYDSTARTKGVKKAFAEWEEEFGELDFEETVGASDEDGED